ncbi:hypothetical protein RVIR1_10760 [Candidatus Rickettsiella viridis]|uniref:Uncharacterized protein n=1 Tax=Candidatus Rickettsiella viridis TaxID=676208 RepID=A0A2Z5UVQ5_9COXI|nr:hypothetical protein [Candidatus Rickettsiella viridis]BBB15544.1 hypothetical protein RVIR1_10760 [Candidatus Rickettsiella viridis]
MSEYYKINYPLGDEKNNPPNSIEVEPLVIANKKLPLNNEADTDEGEGGAGSISLSVEQLTAYLLACFTKERRKGQQKFGPVPFTEDPNNLLGRKKTQQGFGCGEQPHAHPLLAHSQQFSGDDPKLTAIPSDNPKARERFPELRLENQLRNSPSLGRRKSVTLSR